MAGKFDTLQAWLDGTDPTKQAGLPDKTDGGTAATEGARSSENAADVKKIVPGQNIESGASNPDDLKRVLDHGLKATTVGKMPSVEDAARTVVGASDKMAAADPRARVDLLAKMAADVSVLLAAGGTPVETATTAYAYAPAPGTPAEKSAAERIVGDYHRYGAALGSMTAAHLVGRTHTAHHLKQAIDDGTLMQMLAAQGGEDGDPMAGGAAAPAEDPGDPAAMPADPGSGAPGDPTAAPGGEGDPGMAEPDMDDMSAGLGEMGLTPQMLEELLKKIRGGVAEGDAPPEQKEAADLALASHIKFARDIGDHMRTGAFQFKPAMDGTPERARRNVAKTYFRELLAKAHA